MIKKDNIIFGGLNFLWNVCLPVLFSVICCNIHHFHSYKPKINVKLTSTIGDDYLYQPISLLEIKLH